METPDGKDLPSEDLSKKRVRLSVLLSIGGIVLVAAGLGLIVAAYVGHVQVNAVMTVCGVIALVVGVDLVIASAVLLIVHLSERARSRTNDILWRRHFRRRGLDL
jgi:hypothetical protein